MVLNVSLLFFSLYFFFICSPDTQWILCNIWTTKIIVSATIRVSFAYVFANKGVIESITTMQSEQISFLLRFILVCVCAYSRNSLVPANGN